MGEIKLTNEYIRGLVEGEGCFTFHSVINDTVNGKKKFKIPAFIIEMHERDKNLIIALRDHLRLKNRIYRLRPVGMRMVTSQGEKIYHRGYKSRLCVRDFGQLKNVIIPMFYKRLNGNKGIQFGEWLEKIGNDPDVPTGYKLLHRLHKCGYYDKNPKFLD